MSRHDFEKEAENFVRNYGVTLQVIDEVFYFLSPEDYTSFFQNVRAGNYGWKSSLMLALI